MKKVKPVVKVKRRGKKLGFLFILIGIILFASNIYLSIGESKFNVGGILLNVFGKPEFTQDTNILIFASTVSWIIPLIFIFVGIIIAKRSTKNNEKDFFQ
ncbi:MAG: hypothetical protein KAT37_04020 [Candidatus Aenigmarchaeota archaeon]|nr:hypothetical protein [Candidatus Aenigmarchaeota archaeon]